MLIAAALIELSIVGAESIKAKRRVAQAIKGRVRKRFNVSVSEIGDPDDHQSLSIGCVSVGSEPRHLRERLQKVVRYVESLSLAEVLSDDIAVVSLDECRPAGPDPDDTDGLPEEDPDGTDGLPEEWRRG